MTCVYLKAYGMKWWQIVVLLNSVFGSRIYWFWSCKALPLHLVNHVLITKFKTKAFNYKQNKEIRKWRAQKINRNWKHTCKSSCIVNSNRVPICLVSTILQGVIQVSNMLRAIDSQGLKLRFILLEVKMTRSISWWFLYRIWSTNLKSFWHNMMLLLENIYML